MATDFFFLLLDTLTFDQHKLFFSEFFNEFSLAWYSTLNVMTNPQLKVLNGKCYI